MAAPTFVGAGTGVAVLSGTASASKTGCTAGNIIIVQLASLGASEDYNFPTSETNVERLDGTPSNIAAIVVDRPVGSGGRQSLYIGRATADGTVEVGGGPIAGDTFMRVYEFAGVIDTETDINGVGTVENDAVTNASGSGTSTSVADAGVVTNGADRLALQFVVLHSNQALGNMTGETGGDWTEAAEYNEASGETCTLQLQTATMSSAGTINGGTLTVSSTNWGTIGTALIPGLGGQTLLPDADIATTGWATAPLFSKVNDSSDATVITATAS